MSGHSKWATTKHKKAVVDARRGKLFAKLIKNVEVAARTGGADPTGNPTLYDAMQKAKKSSVPNENIDRAIRRGAGLEAGGAPTRRSPMRVTPPAGSRCWWSASPTTGTAPPPTCGPRSPATAGPWPTPVPSPTCSTARAWSRAKADGVTEDDVLAAVLDAGAEDVKDLGQSFEVISEPTDLVTVRTAVTDAGLEYESAEAAFLPTVEVDLDEDQAKRVFRLIEALEDSDDVQDVYANYSVSDDIMEKLG